MINILLIEDNIGYRELFRDLLSETSLKFNLIEADNPIQGLEKINSYHNDFQIVICDFFLPIQNGSDFIEVVHSHSKKIIFLLISADPSFANKKLPHVDYFFPKADTKSLINFLKTFDYFSYIRNN